MGDAGVGAVSGHLHLVFWALSGLCLLRALFMAVFMRAARGRLVLDGYREARRARSSDVLAGGPLLPTLTVRDQISFTTEDGRHLQVSAHRIAKPHVSTPMVWYSPHHPEAVAFTGPAAWMVLATAGFAAAVLAGGS